MSSVVKIDPERERFSKDAAQHSLKPLWERVMRLQPGSAAAPWLWRWSDLRPLLMRAAPLITAKEAERRVLMLENPALPGTTFIATSLFAGMQLILPGEIAPSHRHTPNALRFIVEGEGAYTAVEGERVAMRPGDFVVTRGWTWHDHGNLGSEPVVWMDGLDTAFANLFGAHFREDYPRDEQPLTRPDGWADARFSQGMLPVDYRPERHHSPVLVYPYERTRETLARIEKTSDPNAADGYKMRYANPADGGHPFPTMAAFMQLLPKGFRGADARTTENRVFNVVEGRGTVRIGDATFAFAPHDVFVAPAWQLHAFEAESECVIFSYSDRPAQEALGYLREA